MEHLKENILFCTLTKRELSLLSRAVYERVYQPDESIFHQNERGFGMYIIASGQVAIRTETAPKEILVTQLGKGSFFGELSLIENESVRSASAVATERASLIGFFKPDLMEILERHPTMGVKILFQLSSVLGQRLMETTDRISRVLQDPRLGSSYDNAA